MNLKKSKLPALLAATLLLAVIAAACSGGSTGSKPQTNAARPVEVNIGIQGVGILTVARQQGWFEEAYKKLGATVKWTEFPSGPPHFEAIAANRLDFGLVGNGPVIAGQAGNVDFREIAVLSDGKLGDSILVPGDSGIRSIADLKGKKVAVAKGSSAYTFVYRAAVQAGLKPSDINLIQLQPDEAQAAYDTKAVDAWAIWEPYVSIAASKGSRILANGQQLNLASPSFAVVRTAFAKEHPEHVALFLKIYKEAVDWVLAHKDETVKIYADAKKTDPQLMKAVLEKSNPIVDPVTDEYIKAQQTTADLLFETGGIKQKIDVTRVVDNSYLQQALGSGAAAVSGK